MNFDSNNESHISVHNPAIPNTLGGKRIAFIGDIPYDSQTSMPIGKSHYSSLRGNCSELGLDIRSFGMGNVLNFYPKKIPGRLNVSAGQVPADSDDYKESLQYLINELRTSGTKTVILLGDYALNAFKRDPSPIDDERGSPFYSDKLPGILCIPTHHPRDVFQRWHLNVLVQHDISKAVRLTQEGWQPPKFNISYLPDYDSVIDMLDKFISERTYLSVDLETYGKGPKISCVGIAYSKDQAIVIPLVNEKWLPYWSAEKEVQIWKRLRHVLTLCPLVGQYAVHYDTTVLCHYGIVPNFVDDTMFAAWETYAEMQKSLGFLCSLYTDLPYHKGILRAARSRKIPWYEEFRYCGIDCCACYQVAFALAAELQGRPKKSAIHYRFNIKLSHPYNYMGLRGAILDRDKWEARRNDVEAEVDFQQEMLNAEVGYEINVNSYKQMQKWMYDEKGYPKRQKPVKFDDGTRGYRDTSDYLTVLYMARQYGDQTLLRAGNLRKLKKRLSALRSYNPRPKDGRMGWAFNVTGTETGRSSGYKPIDGHGLQPQNIDRRDKDLFVPDPGRLWLKADLEGADSWTVAAQLAALGRKELLEDLRQGVKPAQVLGLSLIFGPEAIGWPTARIKAEKNALKDDKGKQLYAIAKAINHGSAYLLGKRGMHLNIFKQSDGDIYLDPDQCEAYQDLLFLRYPYPLLHEAMRSRMLSEPKLESASGSVRHFFGRADNQTLREMLSHIPQANTTFVNSVLLYRLYYEQPHPFMLEPLNQVHDEVDFQFDPDKLDSCRELFKQACHVPIECWGVDFEITYDANYGPNWAECEESFL